jgi:hypothetical protein
VKRRYSQIVRWIIGGGEQSHGARLSYSALALTPFCDNAMWGYPSLLEAPKQEMLTVTPRHRAKIVREKWG